MKNIYLLKYQIRRVSLLKFLHPELMHIDFEGNGMRNQRSTMKTKRGRRQKSSVLFFTLPYFHSCLTISGKSLHLFESVKN